MELTESQKLQLLGKPKEGRECLLSHWLSFPEKNREGENGFCDAYWDSIFCWPSTKAGEIVTRSCTEVFKHFPEHTQHLQTISGNAFRICSENASWLWGNWTNYTECTENLDDDDLVDTTGPPGTIGPVYSSFVVNATRYILFIGSLLSFICLVVSLFIFYYFKSLRCDRITVHIHLMVAMAVRFLLLIFIAEPFLFRRKNNYRSVDWACKGVLSFLMYATVASINWMFIQGHYLHGRLTTNVFDRGTPFKIYYTIGWGLPLILISVWTFIMETSHPFHCWKGYSELDYIWIIVAPMILALSVNLLFLINIMRILLTKVHRTAASNDSAQFRRAVKATAVLFPLLGINNLLFIYNPGGSLENAYVIANMTVLSTQGIFVSVLYCFLSSDVKDAFRREYRRFQARRSTNTVSTRRRKKSFNTSVLMMTPRSGLTPNPSISHLGTRLKTSKVDNRSQSPSPETGVNYLQQEEPLFTEESYGSVSICTNTNRLDVQTLTKESAPGTEAAVTPFLQDNKACFNPSILVSLELKQIH